MHDPSVKCWWCAGPASSFLVISDPAAAKHVLRASDNPKNPIYDKGLVAEVSAAHTVWFLLAYSELNQKLPTFVCFHVTTHGSYAVFDTRIPDTNCCTSLCQESMTVREVLASNLCVMLHTLICPQCSMHLTCSS